MSIPSASFKESLLAVVPNLRAFYDGLKIPIAGDATWPSEAWRWSTSSSSLPLEL
jgi:hypothetical protein